eukprot:8887412-Heterocapsa_arctica.AAC.1
MRQRTAQWLWPHPRPVVTALRGPWQKKEIASSIGRKGPRWVSAGWPPSLVWLAWGTGGATAAGKAGVRGSGS